MKPEQESDRRGYRARKESQGRWPVLLLIVALGIGLSVVAFQATRRSDNERIRRAFLQDAQDRVSAFRARIAHSLGALVALESFYAASGTVERSAFRAFTEHHLLYEPGVQALEWIPRIPGSERSRFEESVRREGLGTDRLAAAVVDFQITEETTSGELVRAGERDEYFPVTFVEPLAGNEAALGFDLASNPTRLEALERARDSGETVATARLRLVQETRKQYGVLVFSPVYESHAARGSVEARRRALEGFLLGVFRIGDLLETALDNLEPRGGVDIAVYDRSTPEAGNLLHFHASSPRREPGPPPAPGTTRAAGDLRFSEAFRAADREWLVVATAAPEYLAARSTWTPWAAMLGGLLLTGLLTAYMTAVLGREMQTRQYAANLLRIKNRLESEIGRREHAQEERRDSETRFRELVENMSSGVAVYEPTADGEDFIFRDFNRAAEKIDGVRREEVLGMPLTEIFPGVRLMGLFDVLQRVRRTGEPENVPEAVYEDKRIRGWRETYVYRLPSGEVVAVYDDITERKRLESELLHAQRMEAVGRLAGGVAHDFNNLLQVVAGNAELLLLTHPELNESSGMLEEIRRQVARGAELIRQLLVFSRREPYLPKALDLRQVLEGASKMIRRLVRENIDSRLELSDVALPVLADRGQLEQVLMNLVVNATDAMPRGGLLTIRAGSDPRTGDATDEVWFAVADTGSGIADDIVDKIFDPYFTTKSAPQGSGLGLAVVHGIVNVHGGRIEVDSRPGQGVEFRIIMPRDMARPGSPADEPPQQTHGPPRGDGENVLVVEDQELVRRTVAAVLRSLGYRVTTAGSGAEARARAETDDFALLVTDMILPDASGAELASELKAEQPGLGVLVISGYSPETLPRDSGRDVRFLPKPFNRKQLAEEVFAVLRDRAQQIA